MEQRPAQAFDGIVARNRSKGGQMKIIFRKGDGMLLQKPPVLGDRTRRRFELRRYRVCTADSFAEACHSEQIVADCATRLTEVIEDSSFSFLRRIRGE